MEKITDEEILDIILNPTGISLIDYNQKNNLKEETIYMKQYSEDKITRARELEIEAIRKAEKKLYDEALELFEKAFKVTPQNPSLLNNRAQTYRLKGENQLAMKDLDDAINLCEGDKIVAKQAYTQRGLIKELNGDEEGARKDFEMGAKFGSSIARQEAIKLNPYAKLCNQMLSEAMKKCEWV